MNDRPADCQNREWTKPQRDPIVVPTPRSPCNLLFLFIFTEKCVLFC